MQLEDDNGHPGDRSARRNPQEFDWLLLMEAGLVAGGQMSEDPGHNSFVFGQMNAKCSHLLSPRPDKDGSWLALHGGESLAVPPAVPAHRLVGCQSWPNSSGRRSRFRPQQTGKWVHED